MLELEKKVFEASKNIFEVLKVSLMMAQKGSLSRELISKNIKIIKWKIIISEMKNLLENI